MCAHYLCQYLRHGHVIIGLVYFSPERFSIAILHAALHAIIYGDGYIHLNLPVSDGISAIELQSLG